MSASGLNPHCRSQALLVHSSCCLIPTKIDFAIHLVLAAIREKLLSHAGSWKKQESSRKTSLSTLLTMPKPLTVYITINCRKFLEMRIPDHLTCLLRNLHAGQEAIVRTGHGTTDWFQIGKGVGQGCILSPCLFNLYAEDRKSVV